LQLSFILEAQWRAIAGNGRADDVCFDVDTVAVSETSDDYPRVVATLFDGRA
jgi:hypothetical protein